MEADFSGYATRAGLKCTDGRTIMPDAFKHQDQMRVPLVWQHGHNEPTNVLGHAILENREDGVYTYGFFNDTDAGQSAKTLVEHGDITALSIFANQLVEKAKNVLHGAIREVSLVLSGANPGAVIDNVRLQHSDGSMDELDDEAVIYTGLTFEHADGDDKEKKKDDTDDKDDDVSDDETVQDVYDTLSDKQKDVVHYMVSAALESDSKNEEDDSDNAEHSDEDTDEDTLNHKEGSDMTRNVFEQSGKDSQERPTLSHDALKSIVQDAQKCGSFKEAFMAHAETYGIDNIDIMFPDAKAVTNAPEFVKRRTEWVAGVISGTHHTPFSRIKSLHADITADEARALGYIKGNLKKEEVFPVLKRTTGPTTVYKKQKLDRDDIIDITDLDVVAWLKAEMRVMLDEELARAVLLGDGRETDNDDKIKDPSGANDGLGIRSIANDDDFYAHQVTVPAGVEKEDLIELVLRNRKNYKGTGSPTFFTTDEVLTDLLLSKDQLGRRYYATEAELASALRVKEVVPVEVMEGEEDLVGIIVNMSDYTLGADKGGAVSMFDDFDIDYNQYKYLMETRVSGALTKHKSALVLKRGEAVEEPEDPEGA